MWVVRLCGRGNQEVITAAVQHRDRLIRAGLFYVLEREPDIEVVGQVRDPAELVELCGRTRPDVAVLEVDATEWDGPRLVAALRKRQRTLRVVGMHGGLDVEAARRVYQAGVRSLASYDMGAECIIASVRGRHTAAPVIDLRRPDEPLPRNVLTDREREVLGHIAGGLRTQQIADHLGISLKTVENHKQRLFRKLDVQNQAHAVSIAMRQGLLDRAALAGE